MPFGSDSIVSLENQTSFFARHGMLYCEVGRASITVCGEGLWCHAEPKTEAVSKFLRRQFSTIEQVWHGGEPSTSLFGSLKAVFSPFSGGLESLLEGVLVLGLSNTCGLLLLAVDVLDEGVDIQDGILVEGMNQTCGAADGSVVALLSSCDWVGEAQSSEPYRLLE